MLGEPEQAVGHRLTSLSSPDTMEITFPASEDCYGNEMRILCLTWGRMLSKCSNVAVLFNLTELKTRMKRN